jgi:hypothetical protein
LVPLLVVAGAGWAGEPEGEKAHGTVREEVEKTVRYLAGEELRGRGAWEDRKKAAAFVAKAFEDAGWKPLPGRDSYFVDHGGTKEEPEVRNVAAWLPTGRDVPAGGEEYVILSAHYDHLGVKDGKVYPGADDNASGVAALLEVAWGLAQTTWEEPPLRAFCFVAFDLEEQNLVGSRRFVAEPPVPLDRCAAFVTMDQMGRSIADLAPGTLFLMGGESSPEVASAVEAAELPEGGRKAVLGIDFQPPTGYSDYVPFQEKKVPFLFMSTGACAHYHQPGDVPDKIDYDRLAEYVGVARELVGHLAFCEKRPTWRDGEPAPSLEEVTTIRDLVALAQEKMESMTVPQHVRVAVAAFRGNLDKILESGTVTAAQRTMIRNGARLLFQQAVALLR